MRTLQHRLEVALSVLTWPFFLFAPHLAALFGTSIVVVGVIATQTHWEWPATYLHHALIVYGAIAVYSYAFMTTAHYLRCCAHRSTFLGHFIVRPIRFHFFDIIEAGAWPIAWMLEEAEQRLKHRILGDVMMDVFYFWCTGRTPHYLVDMETGKVTAMYENRERE